jgi:uncharacterized protein YecT (DUF1311 family)
VEPERRSDVHRVVRTPNWTTIALMGGLIVLILLIAYFATSRNPDQDKLTANEAAETEPQTKAAAPEKLCANKQTYDLIKRELFRRAAQLRGSDAAAFDQLSGYAVVRMENPVMESQDSSTGAVNCSGSLAIDLPPGVSVVGGRRTLTADLDYTVQQAADGSGSVVVLRNADAIIAPLATLARTNAAQPAPVPAPAPGTSGEPAQPAQPPPAAGEEQAPTRPVSARPSFDCANARTKGEIAVCSNAGLAALDRNMAAQYARSIEVATPQQKALLRSTRDRFIAYRDRCPNRACIGDAYVGRMREIRDIMEGRWQSQR